MERPAIEVFFLQVSEQVKESLLVDVLAVLSEIIMMLNIMHRDDAQARP